jgi:hypothetical protein
MTNEDLSSDLQLSKPSRSGSPVAFELLWVVSSGTQESFKLCKAWLGVKLKVEYSNHTVLGQAAAALLPLNIAESPWDLGFLRCQNSAYEGHCDELQVLLFEYHQDLSLSFTGRVVHHERDSLAGLSIIVSHYTCIMCPSPRNRSLPRHQ